MSHLKVAKITKTYERKVWIESDIFGSTYVMMRHEDGKSESFCFCQFNYNYMYTSNAHIHDTATAMAISLGATEPVEYRNREIELDA